MNITINSKPVHAAQETFANLEEVLVNLSNTSLPEDHLVGVVRVNGNEFSENYPGQAKEITVNSVENLEVTTVSLQNFTYAAISDSMVFMGTIVKSINETAGLYRIYDETEANEHFSNLMDPLRAMFQFIDLTRSTTQWNFDKSTLKGQTLRHEWDRLHEIIDEIKATQEENDWILMADLLEYELVPSVGRWIEIFAAKSLELKKNIH